MHIQVGQLRRRPRRIEFREPVAEFPSLAALAEQGDAVFRGEVAGHLDVSLVDGVVRVEGEAEADAGMICSRCLEPVEEHVKVGLSLCYAEFDPLAAAGAQEELELTLKDLDMIPFQGDEIDPAPGIAQELIMGLPQSVLCKDDCAGLCPVCGIDLNKHKCRCRPPVFHEGLARLKDFKVKPD